MTLTRTFDAPVELLWEVWTKPEHICQWWGPNGFTCTIQTMEVKKGGDWELVLHGPDGTDYKNKSVFKEVVPLKKLVYEHDSAPRFVATVEFEALGDKTHLTWDMLFESEEEFIRTVKTFKADEGQKQNADKLAAYLKSVRV